MQQSRQPWHYRRKVCVLRPPSESADRLPGNSQGNAAAPPEPLCETAGGSVVCAIATGVEPLAPPITHRSTG